MDRDDKNLLLRSSILIGASTTGFIIGFINDPMPASIGVTILAFSCLFGGAGLFGLAQIDWKRDINKGWIEVGKR